MSLKIETETKVDSEPCVIAWENKLFVGCEDGTIKSFDTKLTPNESWSAHAVQLFAITAGGGSVYSSSNDGGVRVWSLTGEKITELPPTGGDVGTLHVFDQHVYAGDENGNITVYENNAEKAKYNVLEEVKDLWLNPPLLYTVRDLDVTVTEIKPEESKSRFITRFTIEGRAPLRTTNNRLLVMARDGKNLRLHDSSLESSVKKLNEVKVSDMIVTSLSVSEDYVWTGGWDGVVRRWKLAGDELHAAGEVHVGGCINGLVAVSDRAYAAVAGGKIVCVVPA